MATYPDGTLLKASGPQVDQMQGGQRRWIPDPPTFNCMGLDWNAIRTIVDSEWSQIPQGAPYPSQADGALLKGSGPQVYVMASCLRRWIPDPDTFNSLGYNWNVVQQVSDADLTAIVEGEQLPSVDTTQPQLPQMQAEIARLQQEIAQLNAELTQHQAQQASPALLLEIQAQISTLTTQQELLSAELAQMAKTENQIQKNL
jgi:hypothetical protein